MKERDGEKERTEVGEWRRAERLLKREKGRERRDL